MRASTQPASGAGQDETHCVCVVSQLALQLSSLHLATQVVRSESQATTHVSPPRPCWLTVGFSTFVVQPIPAKRHAVAIAVANHLIMGSLLVGFGALPFDVPKRYWGARSGYQAPAVPTIALDR